MRKISKFMLLAGMLGMGFASCTNQEDVKPVTGDAYMQITIKLPSADETRSTTSATGTTEEGTEIGQTYENNVTSLTVYLENGGTIVKAQAKGGTTSGDTYTTVPFPINSLSPSTVYNVYVVVNDSPDLTSLDATKSPGAADLTANIAKPNAFLMTNAEAAGTVTTGADLTVYTESSPLDAGTVKVERAAARFDYRSVKTGDAYELVPSASAPYDVTVTLKSMSLINESKDFYYFRRVSADGTSTSATLGGAETKTNYVVDANFANKTYANRAAITAADYFYMLDDATQTGAYTDISALTTEDNAWSTSSTYDEGGYKIWTYCTENTIGANPTVNQIHKLTTGVVFKAQLTGTKFDGTNHVYVFNGKVYGSWADVVTAKATDIDVQNTFTANSLSDTEASNTKATLATAGFSRFKPAADGKYYAYYTYWNRHNDNGVASVMGPMEFAVVRNNVYKLAVTEISKLGHPNDPTASTTDPEPDPDPINPDDPDEDNKMYMKVAVKILPWTVRKNQIKF